MILFVQNYCYYCYKVIMIIFLLLVLINIVNGFQQSHSFSSCHQLSLQYCNSQSPHILFQHSYTNDIFRYNPSSSIIRRRSSTFIKVRSSDNDESDYYNNDYEEEGAGNKKRRRSRIRQPIRRTTDTKLIKEVKERQIEAKIRHEEALKDPTLLTNLKFNERDDIHPLTKRGIIDIMGLQSMTQIQAKTYATAISGQSLLGRARTGTGKTLAFLIPTIERLLQSDNLDIYRPNKNIGILIVAPTRELAIQIAKQAEDVLTYHNDELLNVLCIYGGTKMSRDVRLLSKRIPSILVTTPGRLLDHINETHINRKKFSTILSETKIVVLDETDRLFEAFNKDMNRILSILPRTDKRQTLLFSATVPKKLRAKLRHNMNIDYIEIDCVNDENSNTANNNNNNNNKISNSNKNNDSTIMTTTNQIMTGTTTETNVRVNQSYIVLDDMKSYISTLIAILLDDDNTSTTNHHKKIVVFFPASKLVKFFSKLFIEGLNIPVYELHSRMSQSSRNRASTSFRTSKKGILFTSDVSARGMDYPDVTLVIQYGAPSTNDGYVHRLGRTGRAGQIGQGLLVLLPFETNRITKLTQLGVQKDNEMEKNVSSSYNKMILLATTKRNKKGGEGQKITIPELLEPIRLRIRSNHKQLTPIAQAAYRAFLAYYIANATTKNNNNNNNNVQPSQIVEYAKAFAYDTGLAMVPTIDSKLASKLKVTGLVEESN